jgi:Family of unknown function (DUF6627)
MPIMQRTLAWLLSAMLMILPLVPAQAAMVGTGEIVGQAPVRADESGLRRFLQQETARQQLQQLGVSADSLDARISRLSDSELARINQGIDSMHAGGTSVLGVVVLIFIIFVITDVIGATDIFPFIHPVR